jgi:hypothetical protein
MCPNQILFDEQIALIGCNTSKFCSHAAPSPAVGDHPARLLRAYPYPHRPYDPSAGGPAARRAGIACAAISPLQRGTR